jgi:hypothetical protein
MEIKKAKVGRPALGTVSPKRVRKCIRVEAEIWEQLQALSIIHDAPVSAIISKFLEDGIKQAKGGK